MSLLGFFFFLVFFWTDDNMHLVNNESQPSAVNVLPHVDNPSFEADETQAHEVGS